MSTTYRQICDRCDKEYISADPQSRVCGACKVLAAQEAARERLEGIKRKLGADGPLRPWEGP